MSNPEKRILSRPSAPLAAAPGEKLGSGSRSLHSHGQSGGGGGSGGSPPPPPAPGGGSAACSSLSLLLTTTSSSRSRAAGTASSAASASIVPRAAAAPFLAPVPSFSSASPSSFYFLPPPPRFPSSSSFNLTSLQGREGGGEAARAAGGGGRDVGGAAAAHLIAHPGSSGRRRLFSSSSIQSLLLRSAAGGNLHHSRFLLSLPASGPWSCNSLGAAAARGDGIRGGDGPGGSRTPRRQQRQRGAFFSFSSPLLLGPDMEDGSNSASCFRRFTDCFLNTSRYRSAVPGGRSRVSRGKAKGCVRGWVHALRKGHFFVSGGEAKTQRGRIRGACVDAWRSGRVCIEDARTKGMLGVTECSLWELAVSALGISASFRDQTAMYTCISFLLGACFIFSGMIRRGMETFLSTYLK